jgi:hypothetical protein
MAAVSLCWAVSESCRTVAAFAAEGYLGYGCEYLFDMLTVEIGSKGNISTVIFMIKE